MDKEMGVRWGQGHTTGYIWLGSQRSRLGAGMGFKEDASLAGYGL